MTQPLTDLGVSTVAVPLPSCGETSDDLGDLYADVDACRQAIAAVDGPVVLCGHSYGGMIITEAGADDHVTQLLYVTSVMPDAGQSQAELIGSEPAPWLQPGDDGTVAVDPDLIRKFFLQDCDQTTPEQAVDVSPVNPSRPSLSHPARSPGSRSLPRTSSAPRISPRRPTCSTDASDRTRDSSSSKPGITRFSHAPMNLQKAWSPRSTKVDRKTTRLLLRRQPGSLDLATARDRIRKPPSASRQMPAIGPAQGAGDIRQLSCSSPSSRPMLALGARQDAGALASARKAGQRGISHQDSGAMRSQAPAVYSGCC